jgi:hypothetical protein
MVIQLTLVCFLLHLWSPQGETGCGSSLGIRLPTTVNGDELQRGPVVTISSADTRVDGSVAEDAAAVADRLGILKDTYALLHSGEPFDGRVLLYVDRSIPWRRLREILAAAAKQDYRIVDFVVTKDPPLPRRLL